MAKKVYLSAPFFSCFEEQLVRSLEIVIEKAGFELFSPSRDSRVISEGADYESRHRAFYANIEAIESSDIVVVVTHESEELRETAVQLLTSLQSGSRRPLRFQTAEGYEELIGAARSGIDPGVMWEMGYAWSRAKLVVSYCDQVMPLNLMTSFSVIANARNVVELKQILKDLESLDVYSATKSVAEGLHSIREKWSASGEIL